MADLVAAAARYSEKLFGKKESRGGSVDAAWQTQAWGYWSDTPEVRFAATWCGNVMSRCRLIAGRRADDGTIDPIDDPNDPAAQLVATIGGGPAGQAAMLKEFGPHLVVAGEAWIVIDSEDRWHVASVQEVKRSARQLEVSTLHGKITVPLADDDAPLPAGPGANDALAIRVWEPHPAKHVEADSPIRSSFALLDELRLLNAAVAAIAKSRLAGRGIIFVPQGAKFPTSAEGTPEDLSEVLLRVAQIAYQEPDSAAAAVPLVVEVPPETIGIIQRLTFESEFDTLAVTLREECIRRFASGLDTPAEVLLGTAGMNHWGQWAIDEAGLRVAIEPKLVTICDGLTDQWLHPALKAQGVDTEGLVVWFDSSGARVRVGETETGFEMYDRGEINGDALRRITDFGEEDAPTDEERERALLIRMLTQAPSLWPQIGPLLGFDAKPVEGEIEEVVVPDPAPGVDLPVAEDPGPPATFGDAPDIGEPAAISEAFVAACDGLVWRAMELAGNRLRSRQPRSARPVLDALPAVAVHVEVGFDPAEVDGLLRGAWDRVPVIAERHGIDAGDLTAVLNLFARGLLVTAEPYDLDALEVALAAALGPAEVVAA